MFWNRKNDHGHDDKRSIREVSRKLDMVVELLHLILRKEKTMSVQLDALTAQVQANTEVEASAIVLIQGLATQIAALKDDPVALQALADSLKASADNLGAAVIANTPAE